MIELQKQINMRNSCRYDSRMRITYPCDSQNKAFPFNESRNVIKLEHEVGFVLFHLRPFPSFSEISNIYKPVI